LAYNTIFNLRLPTEQGADIEGEAAAAKAAGVNFVHLPLNQIHPTRLWSIIFSRR